MVIDVTLMLIFLSNFNRILKIFTLNCSIIGLLNIIGISKYYCACPLFFTQCVFVTTLHSYM